MCVCVVRTVTAERMCRHMVGWASCCVLASLSMIYLSPVLEVKDMLYSTYIPEGETHLSSPLHTCAGDQGVEYPLASSPHLSARGACG